MKIININSEMIKRILNEKNLKHLNFYSDITRIKLFLYFWLIIGVMELLNNKEENIAKEFVDSVIDSKEKNDYIFFEKM